MMKAIMIMALSLLSLASFALGEEKGYVTCTADEKHENNWMFHKVKMDFTVKHFGTSTLTVPYGPKKEIVSEVSRISGSFEVKIASDVSEFDSTDPNDLWSSAKRWGSINNDIFYSPRKYKGFSRYNIDMSNEDGEFDLLLPNNFVKREINSTEKAVLVLTWIADHHGTTVPLKCKYYADPL